MRNFLTCAVTGALVWLTVGCGTAALIGTAAILFWAFGLVIYYGAPVAAALGAAQGVWIAAHLRSNIPSSPRFWMWIGAMLGFLGFPLSFAMAEGTTRWWRVAVFIAAAVLGGAAAGRATAAVILRAHEVVGGNHWRRLARAGVLVAAVAGLEWWLLWPRLDPRFPTSPVTESDVNILAGDARGSLWAGCFSYEGKTFGPSSGLGVSGGSAHFYQEDGKLRLVHGLDTEYFGSISRNGRFSGGRRTVSPDGLLLRERIDGGFLSDSQYQYSIRSTVLQNGRIRNTARYVGVGYRRPC